jgi:hypothetical protein
MDLKARHGTARHSMLAADGRRSKSRRSQKQEPKAEGAQSGRSPKRKEPKAEGAQSRRSPKRKEPCCPRTRTQSHIIHWFMQKFKGCYHIIHTYIDSFIPSFLLPSKARHKDKAQGQGLSTISFIGSFFQRLDSRVATISYIHSFVHSFIRSSIHSFLQRFKGSV